MSCLAFLYRFVEGCFGVGLILFLFVKPLEPHKCAKWEWVPWAKMWTWSKEQAEAEAAGKEVQRKMFLPLVNLIREYPELEDALDGR